MKSDRSSGEKINSTKVKSQKSLVQVLLTYKFAFREPLNPVAKTV
jgi:hypothetical protein